MSLGHEVALLLGPDHLSMTAVTASTNMTKYRSMTAVTAKSAVTARIRKMIYTYITRAVAGTGHLLRDLGVFGARDGSLLRA